MGPDPRFKTGAIPSSAAAILAADVFEPFVSAPDRHAWIPAKLSVWNNSQYGDCVTAEEAFAKATYEPEIFIDTSVVVDWARRHGVLNGATLDEVLDAMVSDGFQVGSQRYNNGKKLAVRYDSEADLKSALEQGPVKIAIASNALPREAGNHMGWFALGTGQRYRNTDHCVALCGYGPAGWLYEQLKVPLPSALKADQQGYLLFTWGTIGFVDHAWIMSTCVEAWLRQPTTVGVPPLPPPTPPTPPVPPMPPVPDGDTHTVRLTCTDGHVLEITIRHVASPPALEV